MELSIIVKSQWIRNNAKMKGIEKRELPSVQAQREKDEIISRIIHAITVAPHCEIIVLLSV